VGALQAGVSAPHCRWPRSLRVLGFRHAMATRACRETWEGHRCMRRVMSVGECVLNGGAVAPCRRRTVTSIAGKQSRRETVVQRPSHARTRRETTEPLGRVAFVLPHIRLAPSLFLVRNSEHRMRGILGTPNDRGRLYVLVSSGHHLLSLSSCFFRLFLAMASSLGHRVRRFVSPRYE
jgi:hypothetical protein